MFEDRRDPRWVPADEWFQKNIANVLPEASEKDRTEGCVDEAFIQRFVGKDKPSLVDPRTMHVLDCPYCMRRVMLARKAHQEQSEARKKATRPARVGWLVAASVSVLAAGGVFAYESLKPSSVVQVAESRPVHATVDLFNAATTRGAGDQASPLNQATLPAARVHLSVILPRFSDPGGYNIVLSKDHAGEQIVAHAAGVTLERSGKYTLTVDMDLRSAQPGAYFLATVRDSDQGVYYYPLQVRARAKAGS